MIGIHKDGIAQAPRKICYECEEYLLKDIREEAKINE